MLTQISLRTATFAFAAAAAAGFGAPLVLAGPAAPPPEVANAQWFNPRCTVPSERDLDVTKKIYEVGKDLEVSNTVMLSAFEAGWVESHMNNLNCGDADSVGVFQQRPSAGWCDEAKDCRNVEHASKRYFQAAKENEKAHPDYTAGELAQSVQQSAYPGRYEEAKEKAKKLYEEAKKESASQR